MSRALLKKSLAFVKNDVGEVGMERDRIGKDGSKKKSVSFRRKSSVEREGRVGKKKMKQRKVSRTTPPATEASSVTERNLLYFRKRKMISARTVKNVVQYSSKKRSAAMAPPTQQRPARGVRTGRTKAERKAERRKQYSVLNIPSLKSVTQSYRNE